MKPAKVLILYARYGSGHIQVAEALKQAFEQQGATRVVMLDLFQVAHPILNAISKFIYRKSFTWFPSFYGWTYSRTKEMSHDRLSARLFNSFGMRTLQKTIHTLQPDLVINTFPMLVMPEWRRQSGQQIPTVAVLTDFVLHNRWIHPEIDKYYVATDELATELFQKGIRHDQVVVSGIPIRAAFQRVEQAGHEKQKLLLKYKLSPTKQKVLLVAGGYGIAWNWLEIIKNFADHSWEIVVVCGDNGAVRNKLRAQTAHLADVHVFGYVEHLEELMKCVDVLVTKAGGITLSEAMSLALPILILPPVPGQELENAQYLESQGAARIIRNRTEITQIPAMIEALKRIHHPLGKQGSAQVVVDDLTNSMQRKAVLADGATELAPHP